MKNDRLFAITNILPKKSVTASMLAKEFDVVYVRFIGILKLISNGVPVYCSQGKGGGISLMGHYSIDKPFFLMQSKMSINGFKGTGNWSNES